MQIFIFDMLISQLVSEALLEGYMTQIFVELQKERSNEDIRFVNVLIFVFGSILNVWSESGLELLYLYFRCL